MSKLDELLNYMARDGYGTPIGYLDTISECRAELAALRQRAEDAEMMLRAPSHYWAAYHGPNEQFCTIIVKRATFHEKGLMYNLERNPITGLPILTAEARKALGRKT